MVMVMMMMMVVVYVDAGNQDDLKKAVEQLTPPGSDK